MEFRQLDSLEDASVNFVSQITPKEALECRYVRREPRKASLYISSQTACAMACRMCHLTQTGQNSGRDATATEIYGQAVKLLQYLSTKAPADIIHWNFMARGEPLSNPNVNSETFRLIQEATNAWVPGHRGRFHLSTIMPSSVNYDRLRSLFDVPVTLYYSLYSLDGEWRRRWLPRATPVYEAMRQLAKWQHDTRQMVVIHHALIAGENDSPEDAEQVANLVLRNKLHCDFRLVVYNPANSKCGSPADDESVYHYKTKLEELLPLSKVKAIARVGFDVKASCGMFV